MSAVDEKPEGFLQTILSSLPEGEPGGEWTVDAEFHPLFLSVRPRATQVPLQGWKLHLSATPQSAFSCLQRALPVLISNQAHFKLANSGQTLRRLGQSLQQEGKFVTVYPRDDSEAVRLAQFLHRATQGSRGPCIRTDRVLCRGSIVYYRYGAFKVRYLQDAGGREVHAIEAANGQLVPDRRLGCYSPPPWAADPFVAAGITEPWDGRPLFANRFLPVSLLQQGFLSDVFLGVDLESKSYCVIKRTRDDGRTERLGGQGPVRLGREAMLLRKMSGHGFPQVIEFLKIGHDAILVLQWIDSVTLDLSVRERLAELSPIPFSGILQYFLELAAAVAHLHRVGFVHRDIKPANVLVSHEGRLYLTDFDSSAELTNPCILGGRGTQGWSSPEQFAGAPAAVTDDIFSLGATMLFICTGIAAHEDPELLLDPAQVKSAFEQIRPDLPRELIGVILRCLARDPGCRFRCIPELQAAIISLRELPAPKRETRLNFHAAGLDEICSELQRRLEREVECIASGDTNPHLFFGDRSQRISLDLASGLSGMLLALAATEKLADNSRTSIRLAAKLLVDLEKQRPEFLQPGLFTGKAGCALALAHAASILGRPRFDAASPAIRSRVCI